MTDSVVLTRDACSSRPSAGNCGLGVCCVPCIYSVACNRARKGNTGPEKCCPDDSSEWGTCVALCVAQMTLGFVLTPVMGCYVRSNTVDADDMCDIVLREVCCGPCYCSTCAMAESLSVNHVPPPGSGAGFGAPYVQL